MSLADWRAALGEWPALAPYAAAIAPLIREAIAIEPRPAKKADRAVGASRLGGVPDVPAGFEWPHVADRPMEFVAQIALGSLAAAGTLPGSGLLSFFIDWDEEAVWQGVVHHFDGALRPAELPPGVKPRPTRVRGVDVEPRVVLPPYSSRFVALDDERGRPLRFDRTTGAQTRVAPPLVALPVVANEAYGELYERWQETNDFGPQHGLLGYDRAMEGEQVPDEVMLLRLDHTGDLDTVVPFLAFSVLYFLISRDALARGDFSAARAVFASTI